MIGCVRIVRGLLALVVLSALVAGLPWVLAHFVGWPLPDHVPTWDEIQATLLNPMSSQLFVDVLAVVSWSTWLSFVLSTVRSVVDIARGIAWSPSRSRGPLHALATTLIGAVLILMSNRALATTPVAVADVRVHELFPVTVAAPLVPGATKPEAPPGLVRVVDEIQLPHDGIYDSLWRVAERVYGPGGGARWPELYQLNRGVEQADGRSLTTPDLVRPGWKITAYVPETAEKQLPQQIPQSTTPAPSTPPSSTTAPAPSEQVVDRVEDQVAPGLDLMTGVYVSVGLAGTISTALARVQLRRRRRYRIGSGERSDLRTPVAPAVRVLHAAHQTNRDQQSDIELVDFAPLPSHERLLEADALERDNSPSRVPAAVGASRGRELAMNLVSTRGLGLAGPGAAAAARALLLHLLSAQQLQERLRVLVPAEDLHLVFDGLQVQDLPSVVEVAASLDTALDEMEASLLTRARQALDPPQSTSAAIVLLASSVAHSERRLQAVLDNGSTLGLAGILLGQWRPGATVVVRADGTVSATSPGLGDELTGARLFNLPATETMDLLAVLREAEVDLEAAEHEAFEGQGRAQPVPEAALPEQRTNTTPDGLDAPTSTPRSGMTVKVFGRFQLVFAQADSEARELSSLLTPKQREMLVHLAMHPEGIRREVLNEAVWPDSRPPRPYNSFHNTLSVLRRVLAEATDGSMTDVVLNDDGRYQLNSELVGVDFWEFQQALERARLMGSDWTTHLQRAVDLYRGELAEDLLASWAEPFREAARRDVLDALGLLIHEHGDADPQAVLVLLERARKLDHYNEGVYRDIMRTQAQLGQHTAIPRTLALLTATLGEIDEEPSVDTCDLAELLQRRRSGPRLAPVDRAAAS